MNTYLKGNKILNNKFVIALLLLLYILLLLPFIGNIAFDAVVHFVFAQNFALGHPFQYNLNDGQLVIASTSPFWTILLALFYFITGQFTPIIIKSVCILLWLATAYLLNIVCRDIWKLRDFTRYAVLLMWFANVSIIKNSLGGLENILCAFQLLLIYYYTWKKLESGENKTNYILGALLGWTALTRIDAGVLALIVVLVYLTAKRKTLKYNFIASLIIIILTAFIVLLPWYLYQYSYTSKLLSDSAVARLFTGRRNSVVLFNGLLYFHSNAVIILFTAFFPLSMGLFLAAFKLKLKDFKNNYYTYSAIILVICSVAAYSFIVGADQFGRYFLMCMPFFLLAGFYGLQQIYLSMKTRNAPYLNLSIVLLIIFMFLTNTYDYYKRVINIEQLESNIYEVYYAPSGRNKLTSEYLQKLGFNESDSIKLAITEVQFKYFVDERVHVISLDGRSSPKILKYMSSSGLPDFERFIEDEKPDIVEVKGWPYPGNLLFNWEEKISKMRLGDAFTWNNNIVTYISPWHVKILYHKGK